MPCFSTVLGPSTEGSPNLSDPIEMKPLAIQIGRRIIMLAGDPKQLEQIKLEKNPRANLVLVKKD